MATSTHEPSLSQDSQEMTAEQSEGQSKIQIEVVSAISELQDAFASILLARKERTVIKPKPVNHTVSRGCPDGKPPFAEYTWTGAFELFSFPRELRDRIYFWYLCRPNPVVYTRRNSRSFPFNHSEDITSLFLVSQQVYFEALQVFCRYTQIEMGGGCKSLDGTLRLFPDKPAGQLQRLSKEYMEYASNRSSWRGGEPYTGNMSGAVWIQMLKDAYVFKSYFPKLREFTASWYVWNTRYFEENGPELEKYGEGERMGVWLEWMRGLIKEDNIVPPRFVRFKFRDSNWRPNEMQKYEGAMNEAYAMLLREYEGRDEERELEESGKRWLEETWGDVKRSKKNRKVVG